MAAMTHPQIPIVSRCRLIVLAGVVSGMLAVAFSPFNHAAPAAEPFEREPTGTIDGHPALARSPRHTTTSKGNAGDAINVAFIGSEEDLHRTLAAAGWYAAFEQPHGDSPKQRHHVRFWRSREVDAKAKPLWLGAATFDERVEISRTTGGITHKIGPDIDKERNKLLSDTIRVGALDGYYWVDRFHEVPEGRNGGGDPYFTDRRLAVGVISIQR